MSERPEHLRVLDDWSADALCELAGMLVTLRNRTGPTAPYWHALACELSDECARRAAEARRFDEMRRLFLDDEQSFGYDES